MLNVSYNNFPRYDISGPSIDPIDVIEDWKLNYNLSCVVKYIGNKRRNSSPLEDLKKAEWYLDRAYGKEKISLLEQCNAQQMRPEPIIYAPQTICEDWKLTDLLCSSLINIFFYREHSSHILKVKALHGALQYLREEIMLLEKEYSLKLSSHFSKARKRLCLN